MSDCGWLSRISGVLHPDEKARGRLLWAICLGLMVLFYPCPGASGTIKGKVATTVTVQAAGKIAIDDKIENLGDDTAYHTVVTTFLGSDARHSDVLGDVKPGGTLRYNCDFDGSALKPGNYIVITRVNFADRGGAPGRIYRFDEFSLRKGEAKGQMALTAKVDTPVINLKSPLGSKGTIRLTLKNGHADAVEPIAYLALPEGLKVAESEMRIPLRAGEEKTVEIPIEAVVKGDIPYRAIVRYEAGDTHFALQTEGKVRVEERPVLFKLFIVAGVIVLLLIVAVVWYVRKKKRG